MKTKLLILVLAVAVALPCVAAPPHKKGFTPSKSLMVDNETYINVNRILMYVTNHGNFGRDLTDHFGQDAGTFYPYSSTEAIESGAADNYVLYASGLWIGGKVNGETRVIIAEYDDEYVPGPMANGTFTEDSDDYRVYKLYRDSLAANPNSDYTSWPVAQGAPVNEDGTPALVGDQMCWAVYNDADPAQHGNDAGETDPLGIEIKQTTFAFNREGALGDIIFIRLRAFNKGGNTIEDCYFSLWADPDLGGYTDDLVGCDTELSLGYVYNSSNDDSEYGEAPPAMGYDFFQGPLVHTGNDADTALMWDTTWAGYQNLGMASFNKYINGTDPNDFNETYNYMQGLEANGDPYVYDNDTTTYMHAGDPTTNPSTGDVDIDPADRRWMQSTGPITFAPGDSTEILAAIIVGQGGTYLKSVSAVKDLSKYAQVIYESGFNPPNPPAPPVISVSELPAGISLTWGDTSEVDEGDYDFEGYTVWQGESPNGPWHELVVFDAINDFVTGLVDTVFDASTGVYIPVIKKRLSNSGVGYRYTTSLDAINGGPLRDITDYYFRVSAFSFAYEYPDPKDPDVLLRVGNGDRFLESPGTVVIVTPQGYGAGVNPAVDASDTLAVTHVGAGDGSVVPMVVNPLALTDHIYKVTFEMNNQAALDAHIAGGVAWHLIDSTTGDTLLRDQFNQSGNAEYFTIDGIYVEVNGPPPGVKDWDIPNGTRRFTWAGGADGLGWEGFSGALGWGGPGDVNGFGTADPVPASTLPGVVLKLAEVDVDGNFDPNDENVSYGYRYGRSFDVAAPARPEFAPFIINTGSYGYQDFEKSVPLSAWNMDTDPPTRLAVGFLENNVEGGLVDGKYWPPYYEDGDNVAGSGPREWLWIYLDDYSETPNPDYQLNSIDDPMPIMYWAAWARRAEVAWETGDEFEIIPNRVNSDADTYVFQGMPPTIVQGEAELESISVVPNPFYLFGPYDPGVGSHVINFHHLPNKCTITIYNLAGEFIDEIEKDDANTTIASWDAKTQHGLPVASGIYLYVVTAEGFGQKVGKIAVFTEVEVLEQY